MANKRALIVSAFNDTGTGEQFTAGATAMIEAGAFSNYEAAGLVRAEPSKRADKTPAKAKGSARRKPAVRPATVPSATPPPSEDLAPSA